MSGFLIDTNVLSEYNRPGSPDAGVKRWLKAVKRRKDAFEMVDFPFSSGVAIVRVLVDEAWKCLESRSPA